MPRSAIVARATAGGATPAAPAVVGEDEEDEEVDKAPEEVPVLVAADAVASSPAISVEMTESKDDGALDTCAQTLGAMDSMTKRSVLEQKEE